jgi:DNA (cytosine-5)-methyltransferase 1
MIYGSVCSGIEAATVAWHPLGWKAAFYSEIDKFPSAVLAHHYPNVPNFGDFTTINPDQHDAIDLLVGGTPCQSFSIAGLRGGLGDDRGNLALEFLRLAQRSRPRWLVWENVPGVLSSNGGRDFGSILGAMVELGYGFAYRVLDAQYVRVDGFARAVPQRRRRVFVVAYRGDWRRAGAVLFERQSLSKDAGPRRIEWADDPAHAAAGAGSGGRKIAFSFQTRFVRNGRGGPEDISPTLNGADAGETSDMRPCVAVLCFKPSYFTRGKDGAPSQITPPLGAEPDKGDQDTVLMAGPQVRRLTERECERLQGFPDDYTAIEGATGTPRYKALGNSMAVNVMRWIGTRIQMVENLPVSIQQAAE